MSTPEEKLQAIEHAVSVAKKRLEDLVRLKEKGQISKAQLYEMDMTIDCIQRGEKILKDGAVW